MSGERERWWLRVYAWPRLLVLVGLALTVVACRWVAQIEVGNDLENLLKGSPAYPVYQDFVGRFGSDEAVLVFFPSDGVTLDGLLELHDI